MKFWRRTRRGPTAGRATTTSVLALATLAVAAMEPPGSTGWWEPASHGYHGASAITGYATAPTPVDMGFTPPPSQGSPALDHGVHGLAAPRPLGVGLEPGVGSSTRPLALDVASAPPRGPAYPCPTPLSISPSSPHVPSTAWVGGGGGGGGGGGAYLPACRAVDVGSPSPHLRAHGTERDQETPKSRRGAQPRGGEGRRRRRGQRPEVAFDLLPPPSERGRRVDGAAAQPPHAAVETEHASVPTTAVETATGERRPEGANPPRGRSSHVDALWSRRLASLPRAARFGQTLREEYGLTLRRTRLDARPDQFRVAWPPGGAPRRGRTHQEVRRRGADAEEGRASFPAHDYDELARHLFGEPTPDTYVREMLAKKVRLALAHAGAAQPFAVPVTLGGGRGSGGGGGEAGPGAGNPLTGRRGRRHGVDHDDSASPPPPKGRRSQGHIDEAWRRRIRSLPPAQVLGRRLRDEFGLSVEVKTSPRQRRALRIAWPSVRGRGPRDIRELAVRLFGEEPASHVVGLVLSNKVRAALAEVQGGESGELLRRQREEVGPRKRRWYKARRARLYPARHDAVARGELGERSGDGQGERSESPPAGSSGDPPASSPDLEG